MGLEREKKRRGERGGKRKGGEREVYMIKKIKIKILRDKCM